MRFDRRKLNESINASAIDWEIEDVEGGVDEISILFYSYLSDESENLCHIIVTVSELPYYAEFGIHYKYSGFTRNILEGDLDISVVKFEDEQKAREYEMSIDDNTNKMIFLADPDACKYLGITQSELDAVKDSALDRAVDYIENELDDDIYYEWEDIHRENCRQAGADLEIDMARGK